MGRWFVVSRLVRVPADMNRDYRIRTIRLWLLTLLVCVWAIFDVRAAMFIGSIPPLGFFFCCCGGECEHCSGDIADEYQIVLSGVANGTCAVCAFLDDTYVVSRVDDNCCHDLGLTPFDPPLGICFSNSVTLYFQTHPEGCLLGATSSASEVILHDNSPSTDYVIFERSTSPEDCAYSSADFPFLSDTADCDFSGATCTVSAL